MSELNPYGEKLPLIQCKHEATKRRDDGHHSLQGNRTEDQDSVAHRGRLLSGHWQNQEQNLFLGPQVNIFSLTSWLLKIALTYPSSVCAH